MFGLHAQKMLPGFLSFGHLKTWNFPGLLCLGHLEMLISSKFVHQAPKIAGMCRIFVVGGFVLPCLVLERQPKRFAPGLRYPTDPPLNVRASQQWLRQNEQPTKALQNCVSKLCFCEK